VCGGGGEAAASQGDLVSLFKIKKFKGNQCKKINKNSCVELKRNTTTNPTTYLLAKS
jgi:hypothetical protein